MKDKKIKEERIARRREKKRMKDRNKKLARASKRMGKEVYEHLCARIRLWQEVLLCFDYDMNTFKMKKGQDFCMSCPDLEKCYDGAFPKCIPIPHFEEVPSEE